MRNHRQHRTPPRLESGNAPLTAASDSDGRAARGARASKDGDNRGGGHRSGRKSKGMSPRARMMLEALAVYAIAGGIIWFELRWVDFAKVIASLEHVRLGWFIGATVASFLVWFFGENLLFARMFSYFHKPTGYRELLPATAASYFLQAINILVSSGAMVVFLRRRKDVGWLAAGFTMTFLGFIDGLMFSALIVIAGLLVPSSLTRAAVPYAGLALTAFVLIAAWWMWRTPRWRFERWLHERPSLVSFREANLAIYGELLAIRFAIMAPQGFLFWFCMRAFDLQVPLEQVLALIPLIFVVAGVPITPVGLGSLQAVAVSGFAPFASRSAIFAMSFAFSVSQILYRIPLGLGSAQVFARMVLRTGGKPEEETAPPQRISEQDAF